MPLEFFDATFRIGVLIAAFIYSDIMEARAADRRKLPPARLVRWR